MKKNNAYKIFGYIIITVGIVLGLIPLLDGYWQASILPIAVGIISGMFFMALGDILQALRDLDPNSKSENAPAVDVNDENAEKDNAET